MTKEQARETAKRLTGFEPGEVIAGPKDQFAVFYNPEELMPTGLGPVLVWPGGAKILPSMYTRWPKWLQDA